MATCIYCGGRDNLVAQLTVTLDDGSKATVDVCQEHAEDATIRTAKQKYMERRNEIDELMEKARAFGLELAPQRSAGGLLLMQATPKQAAPAQQLRPQADIDQGMVDADTVERKERRALVSKGGVSGAHSVESHASIDMTDVREQLGDEVLRGKVRMEAIEKQSGALVAIPTKKVNGLGTTRINVVQTTDQEMQRRFKTMAEQSKSPYGWDHMRHLGKEGIELVNCPICKGDCVIKHNGQEIVCPKCKGKGILG